jgi:proteasome accessory factor B
MALLASKRYLTKSEIFESVAGYSGSQESMDRMFERDKDDLRTLGITIEVGSLDAFFEDELGYRIRPESYELQAPSISPQELAVLSLAARTWQNSFFSEGAQRALRKLESLGIPTDPELAKNPVLTFDEKNAQFDVIWEALEKRRNLQFTYQSLQFAADSSLTPTAQRTVSPYAITLHKGSWYIGGYDNLRDAIRIFKLSRISGEIRAIGKAQSFEVPEGFDILSHLGSHHEDPVQATFRVRKGRALSLREGGVVTSLDSEWDVIIKFFDFPNEIISTALWFGADVILLEPKFLRQEVVSILQGRSA